VGRHSRKGPAPKGSEARPRAAARGAEPGPAAEAAREPYAYGGESHDTGHGGRQGHGGPGGHGGHDGYGGRDSHGGADPAGGNPGPRAYPYPGGGSAYPAGGRNGAPAQYGGPGGHGAPGHTYPQGAGHGAAPHGAPGPYPPGHTAAVPGAPQRTRGGHPEQHEPGGGWGAAAGRGGPPGQVAPGARVPGPRRGSDTRTDPGATGAAGADSPEQGARTGHPAPDGDTAGDLPGPRAGRAAARRGRTAAPPAAGAEEPAAARTSRGRTLTGVAAAAVTTVLAVVVAGQVAADQRGRDEVPATGTERGDAGDTASRSDNRPTPTAEARLLQEKPAAAPVEPQPVRVPYEKQMAARFDIDPELTGSGEFAAVPGFAAGTGKGRKLRYRVDIEKGLPLDGVVFATAVHRTLNDNRSWAHGGAMHFDRISSGDPDFVVTLASPGTTDFWCAKSDLDTSISKVSCDSGRTERVMFNAYRWARGSETFGPDAMHAYRQMLINHEVGHRLGHLHVSCTTPGALAPVMQQQTKSLNVNGISCRPNPWVYPDA
jgi:hypothetical protein